MTSVNAPAQVISASIVQLICISYQPVELRNYVQLLQLLVILYTTEHAHHSTIVQANNVVTATIV